MRSRCPGSLRTPRSLRDAFSLPEVIVVVVLVGLLAEASIGHLGDTAPATQLRHEAHELLSTLRYAHQSALTEASLGSGIQYQVQFPNINEYSAGILDPAVSPVLQDLSTLDPRLGRPRRLGNEAPGNMLGDPPNPAATTIYFTNAAGQRRNPAGAVGDRIVYRGRNGPARLPWSGPAANPRIYDRIVVTNQSRSVILRLAHWTGQGPSPTAPWIEVSLDDFQNIP